MANIVLKVNQLPDLSLNKYQSLSDTGVDGVLIRHSNFLRQWHGICMESNTSFHLLYVFDPSLTVGSRLNLYLIIQGERSDLDNIKPLLFQSPLCDFFVFEESTLPSVKFNSGATLLKNERIAKIYNQLSSTTKSYHYVPCWEMNESGRLFDLFKIMETISLSYKGNKPCAYRVDLYPTDEIESTREMMLPILKDLQGENDIQLIKDNFRSGRDSYAQTISKEYEKWMSNLESSPNFRVNVYGFADTPFLAKMVLNAVASEAIAEGDFTLAPIKADSNGSFTLNSRMGRTVEAYCLYPNQSNSNDRTAARTNESWATTYTLEEVNPFFRLPVLYDGEVIEIRKETAPSIYNDGLYIGKDDNDFDVYFAIEDLPRHAFFTGTPGSGKTNTMLHIATELKKKKIPFLVMEPAKKEYRELLNYDIMEDVYLFSPHVQSLFPLKVNPFEFPIGVRVSEHVNALLEVFKGSFVLEGATYKFLKDAIINSYKKYHWDIADINCNNGANYIKNKTF